MTAIIDYGMGNLFSVRQACRKTGIDAQVTSKKDDVDKADALILPGVGAFGDAMRVLRKLDLISSIKQSIMQNKPFLGICLGMQLLMQRSHEFGRHEGLGVFEGDVVQFKHPRDEQENKLPIPEMGWNRILPYHRKSWSKTLLQGVRRAEYMYFVHSYFPRPKNTKIILTTTIYGTTTYCSTIEYNNIFACQYHPERSGLEGIKIYKNFSTKIKKQ